VPRAQAPVEAVLSLPASDYQAAILDISRTGVRLRAEIALPVGQKVGFRAEDVRAAAEVVWSHHGNCALEFDTPIATCEVQRLRWVGVERGSDR